MKVSACEGFWEGKLLDLPGLFVIYVWVKYHNSLDYRQPWNSDLQLVMNKLKRYH